MADQARIGLDNEVFKGRLKQVEPAQTQRQFTASGKRFHVRAKRDPKFKDVRTDAPAQPKFPTEVPSTLPHYPERLLIKPEPAEQKPKPTLAQRPVAVVVPQPFAAPAKPRQQPSKVLTRPRKTIKVVDASQPSQSFSRVQIALTAMAVVVFMAGMTVSLQTFLTNQHTTAEVSALDKKTTKHAESDMPSTAMPSGDAFRNYTVNFDMPRYIQISKLKVNTRVLQVNANSNGELGTPSNVHDAAWYTGSAKPGQPGATLIDGHVSSWKTLGVFYNIKKLLAGDTIDIVRGDNSVIHYRVVKTQVYDASHVDMQAAMNPITPGKSGLNLISCTGKVKPGTSEFNQRIVVFAEQI